MPAIYLAEFLQGAAAAVAAYRLLSAGLARTQWALFSFLVLNAAALAVLGSLPVASHPYFWIFIGYTALNWLVSCLAVREMFALSMGGYPGIRSAARWSLYLSVTVAVSLSFLMAALAPTRNGRTNFFYIQLADRSIAFSLAVVVAGLLLFLSRYPLHLSRNTYVSCSFFSAILLCQAAVDLIDSLRTLLFSRYADTAEVLICGLAFLGWAAMVRPERESLSGRITFVRPDETELLRQLEAMNRLLTRVGRQ
jgi:hypothetical protein